MKAKKQIVVVTSGWVLIGMVTKAESGVKLTEASVIRVWGTTAGLGQIALQGPTKDTVLDPCGDVEVPIRAVVMCIDCVV